MVIFVLVGRSAADLMHESGSEKTVQSRGSNSPEGAPVKRSLRPQSAAVTRNPVPALQLPRQGEGVLPELEPQEAAPATAAAWDSLSLISSSSEASMPGGQRFNQ